MLCAIRSTMDSEPDVAPIPIPEISDVEADENEITWEDVLNGKMVRLGCTLHVYDLAVMHGFQSPMFAEKLQKGSWNKWSDDHVIALAGLVWWLLSSSSKTTNIAKFGSVRRFVVTDNPEWTEHDVDKEWKKAFIRPVETRWMVKWEAMQQLDERYVGLRGDFRCI